jgi:AcrR family transcriptional regulator
MSSPGIPARLKKIAAIAGTGTSTQQEAIQASQSSQPSQSPQPTEPALTLIPASTEFLASAGAVAFTEPSLADTEPEVVGHVAVEQLLRPVPKALTAHRRITRSARPRRGRPRSEYADRQILDAAKRVLADKGVSGMTIEEVASRAEVAKTTIYRRWSSRGTLALDAFLAEFEGQQALLNTGTLAGDLRAALGSWVNAVAQTSAGVIFVGLITEVPKDRGLAIAWQDQVIAPLRAQYSIILDRAIRRGEIPADTDAGVVLDLVFGACYYRLLHSHRLNEQFVSLNDQFVSQIADIVALGVGAGR